MEDESEKEEKDIYIGKKTYHGQFMMMVSFKRINISGHNYKIVISHHGIPTNMYLKYTSMQIIPGVP